MLLLLSQDEPGQGHAVGVEGVHVTHLGAVEVAFDLCPVESWVGLNRSVRRTSKRQLRLHRGAIASPPIVGTYFGN